MIPGASSGIGWELAQIFARHGHSLVLCARSAQRLEQLAASLRSQAGVEAQVLVADRA